MIFHHISHRIALQFTAFVFLLFVVNGVLFLAADFGNTNRQMRFRLERMAENVALRYEQDPHLTMQFVMPRGGIPPHLREQVRLLDAEGNTLFTGSFFENVPFSEEKALSEMTIDGQEYVVLTNPFLRNGKRAGFVQVAEAARFPRGDLPTRALIYLLITIAVSVFAYAVGLFFARRSLKPAEEMMERLEQFTQDASHEIRTPLAALNSSLDLALKTKKYHEGISEAKEDVKQITHLVERLLELARLDAFHVQTKEIDLTDLVLKTSKRFTPLAEERNCTLEHDAEQGVKVQGDPALVRQVLQNLLSNAIKFSKPAGGTVRIRLTSHLLSVEDNGIGIAPADLTYVFNRFYQADASRTHDGLGLGLALAKRIVELHGWTISTKSEQGKGTTFTVVW